MTAPADRVLDQAYFRRVMGAYPTGVVAITAIGADGQPVAMLVGSFGSVSLDPPLVMYMPTKRSSTYAALKDAQTWCVNVLGKDQEQICRAFSLKGSTNKFEQVAWHPSTTGAPIIEGSVAWIECETEAVHDAGDHDIVLGRVLDLATFDPEPDLPLVFYQGGYGRFSPHSRVVPATQDTLALLRVVDAVQPRMEALAAETGVECAAVGHVEKWVVGLAGVGAPTGESPSRIGIRLPLEAPMGPLFVAWEDESTRRRWLREGVVSRDESVVAGHLAALDRVRERGWTVTLYSDEMRELDQHVYRYARGDGTAWDDLRQAESRLDGPSVYELDRIDPGKEYAVRDIAAPVFDDRGRVVLYLSLRGFPETIPGERLAWMIDRLAATTTAVSGVHA